MPRSGNTLLSALLNQNPNFYSSPLSPALDMIWGLAHFYNQSESSVRNPAPHRLNSAVKGLLDNYYLDVDKHIVFDRDKNWLTPSNIQMLTSAIDPTPKIVFTIRDTLDILASLVVQYRGTPTLDEELEKLDFFPSKFLPREDAICEHLMSASFAISKSLVSLHTATDPKYANFVHIIHYDKLVTTPTSTLTDLYSFLKYPYFTHDFNSVIKIEVDNDKGLNEPESLHEVRSSVSKTSINPAEVLSPYIIEKYRSSMDFFYKTKIGEQYDLR